MDRSVCRSCKRSYVYRPNPIASKCCGRLLCRAMTGWGPDDWAGAARMAQARQAAGIPLTDLDTTALRKAASL